MPLYEYQCNACGHCFEAIRKFSDPPVDTCPACGGGPVQKLVSSPAFQFKGTGWYVTDYARKGGGADKPAASEAGESKEASSTGGEKGAGDEKKPSGGTSDAKATTPKAS